MVYPVESTFIFFSAVLVCWLIFRKSEGKTSLRDRLRRFFKTNPKDLPLTSKNFQAIDFPNIDVALRKYVELHDGSLEIIGHGGLALRELNQTWSNCIVVAVQYQSVDVGVDERRQVPKNGLYLIDCDKGRIACQISSWSDVVSYCELIIMSAREDVNAEALEEIRKLIGQHSLFRGKIISLEGIEATPDSSGFLKIRFHEFPQVSEDEIILPEKTLKLVQRNVISFYKHAEVLKKAGKSVKRGVLFYGKPGTGKTFTAKFLAQYLEGVTVFILSGEQLWLIKEAFQLARFLAPSMVIMEDVDLIAHTRDETLGQTVLHQLLNELDGLTKQTECIFLLTTNRPEVLEPALSLRPGRIDQAIEFPLPDKNCRNRLINQYAVGMELKLSDMKSLVERTEGASPAFIQELMRKAALIAAEDMNGGTGDDAATLTVEDSHLKSALDELLLTGSLTRTIVGFHPRSD
ncbi:MAG: ATP-binding protein [Cyanobacteria bacterium]|nr:ATP-binding protein [Cyanobacteriota bacterium]